MKKTFLFCLIAFFTFKIFAVDNYVLNDSSIISYRNALEAIDAQDYGKALKYSEDAILYRKQNIEKQISTIKNSLAAKSVQAAGDRFIPILSVLNNRGEKETAGIINYYLKKKGTDFFEDSMKNLLEYLENSKAFPEAHKIIGDIYKLEGEYQFAEEYYLLALKNAAVLDIPDEKYEILYMLAEISRLQNNLPKMEVRLLNILAEDSFYKDSALKRAILGTISSNNKNSVEKFFNLYRAGSYNSISAYNQLAEYYHNLGEGQKALEFASLAAITSFSHIIEILQLRNSVFEYEGLASFMQEAGFYDDVVSWGNKTSAWKSFNILAHYASEAGYNNFARDLLRVIARYSPEVYWQRDAVLMLEKLGSN